MRNVVRLSALAVAAASLLVPVAGSAATHNRESAKFSESGCSAPNYSVLGKSGKLKKPKSTKTLADGVKLNIWDTGGGSGGVRISEVYVPASSSAHLHVWSSGALTRSEKPTLALKSHKQGIAISNGDVFDPGRGSLPDGAEVMDGTVDKATRSQTNVIAMSKSGRLGQGLISLFGSVSHGGSSEEISGLNWESLAGTGINVYTKPWGNGGRPAGSVDVVVDNGIVQAVKHSGLGHAPSGNQQILTGTGSAASFLDKLSKGDKVTVSYGYSVAMHTPEAQFRAYDAIDHDAPYLLEGQNWPVSCSGTHAEHLARTAVGFDQKGNAMLVAVSGPNDGQTSGGSTYKNMEFYMRRLGAYNADALDGDTSTTLAVRYKAGGSVHRIDHTSGHYQRAVPNYIGVQ